MDATVSILSYDDKNLNISNNVTSLHAVNSYFTKIHYVKHPLCKS